MLFEVLILSLGALKVLERIPKACLLLFIVSSWLNISFELLNKWRRQTHVNGRSSHHDILKMLCSWIVMVYYTGLLTDRDYTNNLLWCTFISLPNTLHFENKIELAVIKNSFSGSLIAGKTHQSVFYSYSYSTITLLFAMHDDFYAHVFIFSKNYVLFITVLNHITAMTTLRNSIILRRWLKLEHNTEVNLWRCDKWCYALSQNWVLGVAA